VEAPFQIGHGDMGQKAVVEPLEWEAKFEAELLQAHFRHAAFIEDGIGRRQHCGQIIHQRARPIKNDVPQHERKG
jgi:hypothetical protein